MSETLYQIMGRHRSTPLPERKPSWLKVRAPGGPNYARLKHLMRELGSTRCARKRTAPTWASAGSMARRRS